MIETMKGHHLQSESTDVWGSDPAPNGRFIARWLKIWMSFHARMSEYHRERASELWQRHHLLVNDIHPGD